MGAWGGARPGSGRWSKAELDALAAGASDEAVAAIAGRKVGAVRAKRAQLVGKPALRVATAAATVPAEPKGRAPAGLSARQARSIIAQSHAMAQVARRPEFNPFRLPAHPPEATPPPELRMAMDDALSWAGDQWMAGALAGLSTEGLQFLGYPFLSELTQRPEYRVISETIADDATRKGIDFDVSGNEADADRKAEAEDEASAALAGKPVSAEERRGRREDRVKKAGKSDKIKQLKDDQQRLELREHVYAICRDDGFFGRSHLFLDFGDDVEGSSGAEELKTPVGDGRDDVSRGKIAKGSLKGLSTIEAQWVYPTTYNASNPLQRKDWYKPQVWYVLGKQLHASRLLTFVGHPVPDMLKPAYSFGGLSLSQMAKPYVDIWIKTRESVGTLIHSFSVMVLCTDLQTLLAPGGGADALMLRVQAFNAMRDNQGAFVINKMTEDFKNVSASLSGLHELQAQSQEHMMSVARIPDIKFTGINPSGLNASTDGTMRAYYDTIAAYQNRFIRPNLTRVINFEQLSLWGEVDDEIIFDFEPLWEMSKKEEAELQKMDAERHQVYVDMGAIAPEEVRGIAIADPKLPYGDLDPDDVPDLKEEEEQGLEPEGGRPNPLAGAAPGAAGPQKTAAPGGGDGNVVPFLERAGGTTTRSPTTASDAAQFSESDHPRAPDGKFGQGSGSEGAKGHPGGGQEPAGALDPAKLTKVGPQMGSNPGGVYEAADGRRYYIKKGQTKDHVRNELLAASLYDLAGAPILRYVPVAGAGHVATELTKLDKDNARKFSPAELKAARKDFVAHAWLANYDAVGTGSDNLGTVAGKPTALDLGGALEYRARGAPKGDMFGDKVGELDTMRNPSISPDAARVFGPMSEAELKDSAARVTEIPDEDVRDIVRMSGSPDALADKLVARKHDIAKRFGLATDEATFNEGDHPRAPDGKFGSSGSGGGAKGGESEGGIPDFLKRKPGEAPGGGSGEHQRYAMPQYGLTRPPSHHLDFFKEAPLTPEQKAERDKAAAERAAKMEAARKARLPKSSGDPKEPGSTVVFGAGEMNPVSALNGVAFTPWEPPTDWAEVDGQADIEEGPVENPKEKDVSSGVIVREPDGRVWLMRPKGGFGGYDHTFPKGRAEDGLSLQANAIKEAWEETGLKVKIKALAGDFEGDATVTRYYVAEREGGTPEDASWEAEAVVLAPAAELKKFLNRSRDRDIASKHAHDAQALDEANFEEGKHPRDASGKFSSTGGGSAGLKHYKPPASGEELSTKVGDILSKAAQKSSTFRWTINNLIKEVPKLVSDKAMADGMIGSLKLKVAESWGKERDAALAKGEMDVAEKILAKMEKLGFKYGGGSQPVPVQAAPTKPAMSKNLIVQQFGPVLAEIHNLQDLGDAINFNSAFKESVKGMTPQQIMAIANSVPKNNATPAQQSVAKQAEAAKTAQTPATPAELEKAKKNVVLKLQYVPGAPQESPAAQKLVDEFNAKWAGKDVAAQPDKLKEKVSDFKKMQQAMVPLMSAQQQAAAKAQAEQQANAAKSQAEQQAKAKENAAKQAAVLKAQAEEAKQKNAHVMKELGITDSEADGFNALVDMIGGSQADVIQKFKSYEAKAKQYGYPISGFQCALISNYSDGGYGGINKALRSGSWTVAQHVYAKLMNKALQSMPKYEGVAKRGTSLPNEEQAKYKVGHVVQEHGFTSASPTKPWSGNTQYTIKAIGKRASHIKKLSNHPGEDEVVFSARTYFKVTKVEGAPGGHMHVHMEEMEHDV